MEMLDWLRRDTAALAGDTEGDTDSELGLELSPQSRATGTRVRTHPGTVLLPNQVHLDWVHLLRHLLRPALPGLAGAGLQVLLLLVPQASAAAQAPGLEPVPGPEPQVA